MDFETKNSISFALAYLKKEICRHKSNNIFARSIWRKATKLFWTKSKTEIIGETVYVQTGILSRWPFFSTWFIDSRRSQWSSNKLFCGYWPIDSIESITLYGEKEKTRIANIIMEDKNKVGGLTLPNIFYPIMDKEAKAIE